MKQSRLHFVDGLRGVAALVVAVGHIIGMVPPDHPVAPIWRADLEHLLLWPWLFGKPMVSLFIMLSGFTLYWSEESRVANRRSPSTLRDYWWRRLWRIAPTYYLSFAFGLLVTLGLTRSLVKPSPSLDTSTPVTLGGLLAHLGFVHNLSRDWIYQANPPLWSIAVEIQLYLLLPVIFMLTRRFSIYAIAPAMVVAVYGLNQAVNIPVFSLIEHFLVGAIVAHVLRRNTVNPRPALTVAVTAIILGLLRIPFLSGRPDQLVWLVGFAALIVGLYGVRTDRWNPLTRPTVLWIGARSYSLYAVHFPIALLTWAAISRTGWERPFLLVTEIATGTCLSILAAAVAYRFIEKPALLKSRSGWPVPVGTR